MILYTVRHIHEHHLSAEFRELFGTIVLMLASIHKDMKMISQEVQALIDQSAKARDVLSAMDVRFKAMNIQMGTLQATINQLRAGAVLSDAEKQQVVTLTGELAANVSNAQADILANTNADPTAPPASPPSEPPVTAGSDAAGTSSNPPATPVAAPATPPTEPTPPASSAPADASAAVTDPAKPDQTSSQ